MKTSTTARRVRAQSEIDSLQRDFSRLTKDKDIIESFGRLVLTVRQNSDLLKHWEGARQSSASVAGVVLTGLYNLALFHRAWRRSCEAWVSKGDSARARFSSLVRHLIDDHPVPEFMIDCWLQESDTDFRSHQNWYIHMARSGTIRGTETPFSFSKRQARCFAAAPHHFTIEEAIRWGRACRTTQVCEQRCPKLTNRRRWKEQQAHAQCWRRGEWPAIPIPNYRIRDEHRPLGRYWIIRQLLHRSELIKEGRLMSHCVATYYNACLSGETSIWSMKICTSEIPSRRLTIEVDPGKRLINTALGYRNRDPWAAERHVMESWAAASNLTIASWV